MRKTTGKIGRVSRPSWRDAAGAVYKCDCAGHLATPCNLAVDCIARYHCCEGCKDNYKRNQLSVAWKNGCVLFREHTWAEAAAKRGGRQRRGGVGGGVEPKMERQVWRIACVGGL